ncbi:MAG: phosphocholine cytidylyltransferase family protein [Sandaracinaceae bacterium]|nr:phosphocholine cytidylyltransferase family protein [Sandaracinaceae bacterium]
MQDSTPLSAVILAAGRGSRLGALGASVPKCLVEVGGRPLVEHQLVALRDVGVRHVVVVVGFRAEAVRAQLGGRVRYVENPRYAETNSLYSLALAREAIEGPFMLLNSDTLAHPLVYRRVAEHRGSALAYDSRSGTDAEHMKVVFADDRLVRIDKRVPSAEAHGENVGILKFDAAAAKRLFERAASLVSDGRENDWAPAAVQALAHDTPVRGIDIADLPWTEIDFPHDLAHATTAVWPIVERSVVSARHPAPHPTAQRFARARAAGDR